MRALLQEIGGHEVVGEAANGRQVLEMAQVHRPDVVLLDIGMPGVSGMEAARRMSALESPPLLIFTTAYSEYALEAFECQAADYLLKPVSLARLRQALQRAHALQVRDAPGEPAEGGARTHISVTHLGALRLIPLKQIYYFKADQKYVTLRWPQGEALTDESLVSLEKEFAGQFLRIHRNALVALVQVAGLEKTGDGIYRIVFQDIPDRLEVSRRHLSTVRAVLKDVRR
jgi:two-component system response regulator AlgR